MAADEDDPFGDIDDCELDLEKLRQRLDFWTRRAELLHSMVRTTWNRYRRLCLTLDGVAARTGELRDRVLLREKGGSDADNPPG